MSDKRILFVDDDPDIREDNQTVLQNAGFNVVLADSLDAARDRLENETFDLLVTDLMMERADSGFTLAFHAKKLYPELPVVIISSVNSEHGIHFSLDSDAERAWIKADAFLNKPFRAEQLVYESQRLTGTLPHGH